MAPVTPAKGLELECEAHVQPSDDDDIEAPEALQGGAADIDLVDIQQVTAEYIQLSHAISERILCVLRHKWACPVVQPGRCRHSPPGLYPTACWHCTVLYVGLAVPMV